MDGIAQKHLYETTGWVIWASKNVRNLSSKRICKSWRELKGPKRKSEQIRWISREIKIEVTVWSKNFIAELIGSEKEKQASEFDENII